MTVTLTRTQIQARTRARNEQAAIAELRKNGIKVLEPVYKSDALGTVATVHSHQPAIAPIPPVREFHSRPDAVEMGPEDRCNIQPLRPCDVEMLLAEISTINPTMARQLKAKIEDDWSDLLTPQERFTLTAMAARKYLRNLGTRQRKAK